MADTKQHAETLTTELTDASEIYFEKEVATVWTPFRTTLLALKNYFLSFFPAKTIQLTYDQAVAIIDSTSDGQEYRLVESVGNLFPDGVQYILTKGIFNGTKTFAEKVTVVMSDGTQIEGRYNLSTNTLVAFRKLSGTISQSNVDKPTMDIFENTFGEVPVLTYHGAGDYDISFSVINNLAQGKSFINFGAPRFDIYTVGFVLGAFYYSYNIISASTIRIYSIDANNFTAVDEGFKQTYFEIIHKI